MDGQPPPPPPPHGANPRTTSGGSGLPPGNYDIFIIPPHSAGGGFIYLPSLQPERNSFAAGVACTVAAFWVWSTVELTVKEWFHGVKTQGGSGIFVLVLIVGAVAWVLGKAQQGGGNGPSGPGGGPGGSAGGAGSYNTGYGSPPQGAGYQGGGAPPPPPRSSGQGPGAGHGGSYGNQHHYHQTPQSEPDPDATPPPGSEMPKPDPPKSSWGGSQKGASEGWEKAREETRRREAERKKQEEQRKKAEEERKQQEEAAKKAKAAAEKEKWEKMRQREKEAREREARERIARERLAKEKEAQEKAAKEKETQEAAIKAKLEREIREKLEAEELSKKEAADRAAKEASATADKAAKDREERLKAARERVEKLAKERSVFGVGERTNPYDGASPSVRSAAYRNSTNNYERPTAKSYMGTDDDGVTHSFRPYDEPRRPGARTANSFVYSEGRSSYAPSATTARTTPPPSQRGTYTTADPDKVVIKAVYLFNDLFPKPVAQLISGVGNVTDGLILRITTEGLFIDDDVRGVPQREWDVKAWTMKLVEEGTRNGNHVLRASIRDPEGKKYVFVIGEEESWKVVKGVQRLKRGTQVRSLGQSGLSTAETTKLLTQLGYT